MRKSILILALLLPIAIFAQIPQTISYQGVLTDEEGMPLADGNYELVLSLHDAATAGNELWSEAQSVNTVEGVFSTMLGAVEPLDLAFDKAYWLEISVDGEILSPRTAMTSAPYSLGGKATEVEAKNLAQFNKGMIFPAGENDSLIHLVSFEDFIYFGTDTFQLDKSLKPIPALRTLAGGQINAALGQLVVDADVSVLQNLQGVSKIAITAKSNNDIAVKAISQNSQAVFAKSTDDNGVYGESINSIAIEGRSINNIGIKGVSIDRDAILGESELGIGVHGLSNETSGVRGESTNGTGIAGFSETWIGAWGQSTSAPGVRGESEESTGVLGISQNSSFGGVTGQHTTGAGVLAVSSGDIGLIARGPVAAARLDGDVLIENNGRLKIDNVPDENTEAILVWGSDKFVKKRPLSDLISDGQEFTGTLVGHDLIVKDDAGTTVFEVKTDGSSYHKGVETFEDDVILMGTDGKAIKWVQDGTTYAGFGRKDLVTNEIIGVYGRALTDDDLAGAFDGDVDIRGLLCVDKIKVNEVCVNDYFAVKDLYGDPTFEIFPDALAINGEYAMILTGGAMFNGPIEATYKNFKIDHPLDPENKILRHYSIESDELKNSYDGNVILNNDGEAEITLPDWFEALNEDFRYQLTCVGGFANVYIKEEIRDNRFMIAGGQPGMKVSWMVTGVRHDREALENIKPVEDYKLKH